MNVLTAKTNGTARASGVEFTGEVLREQLSDGREINPSLKQVAWLQWLANATPKQRANWSLKHGGYAIYWEDLNDGIEVCHLLDAQHIA